MALDPAANRLYWGLTSGGGKIEHASLAGDGSDSGPIELGDANHNNLDGVTLLKDPEPVSPPVISGTPETGQTLTCGDATWAADLISGALYRMPKSTAFGQWTLDGNPIAGATDPTYTPETAGDYRCTRTATNFAGTTTQTSDPVTVTAAPTPDPDPEPVEYDRRLTIRYNEKTDKFSGKLTSSEDECEAGKVTVHKRKPGKDPRIGSDRTNADGAWSEKEKNADGRFYAKVGSSDVAGGSCPDVKSRTMKVG
jgi:hypothetical protein